MKNNLLLLFIKYPEPGKVKTRLAKDYTHEFSSELYKSFIFDLILELSGHDYFKLAICYSPPEKTDLIKSTFGENYKYLPQSDGNIGLRMKEAFLKGFDIGYRNIIIIGSDVPDLSFNEIKEAFLILNENKAVIGPSFDGGYYLIGFNKENFLPEVFDNINWSTGSVFKESCDVFKRNKQDYKELSFKTDIDYKDDLIKFFNFHKSSSFSKSKTMEFLINSNFF